MEFTQPVSNLSFYVLGVDAFFSPFAVLDVYRDGTLYATYPIYGTEHPMLVLRWVRLRI